MALTFPYSFAALANCLNGYDVPLDLQRNETFSGQGSGRYWSSTMAPPLWTATINLLSKSPSDARRINALVNALDGAKQAFMFSDMYYPGPAHGTTGLGAVLVHTVNAERDQIRLKGLPNAFQLRAGEYLSIQHATGRFYFGQAVEDVTASAGGITGLFSVYPYLPLTVLADNPVELVRPEFKAIVPPGGFVPFSNHRGLWGNNASITVLQKP